MMKMKCEIPVTLMKRAIAFEKLLADKFDEYSFDWENYEEDDEGYKAVYIVVKGDITATIVLDEHGTAVYAFGMVNKWRVDDPETFCFKDLLESAAEYQYLSLSVWEDKEENGGILIDAEYHLPEVCTLCSLETYAIVLDEVLDCFIDEAQAFSEAFEDWN